MACNLKTRLSFDALETRETPASLALPSGVETQILFPVFSTGTAGKVGILLPALSRSAPAAAPALILFPVFVGR